MGRPPGLDVVDRWLARRLTWAFATFLAAGSLLYLVIDTFSRLDSLARRGDVLGELWRRNAFALPQLFLDLSPVLLVLSALWVVGALRRHNELLPLLAAGYGPRRLAAPFLLVALGLAPLVWLDREVLLPRVAQARRAEELARQGWESPRPIPDNSGGVLVAGRYLPGEGVLREVRYVQLDPRGREAWTALADVAWVSSDREGWVLWRGHAIARAGRSSAPGTAAPADRVAPLPPEGLFVRTSIRRDDVIAAIDDAPSFLSAREVRRQLARTPGFRHLEVQLHDRASRPFAALALLLLCAPLALGGAGGVAVTGRFAACIGIAASYYLVTSLCAQLGAREALPPAVAAFLPPVAYGLCGLVALARSP